MDKAGPAYDRYAWWMTACSLCTISTLHKGGNMNNQAADGELQVRAAISLIEVSRLMRWDTQAETFTPVTHGEFEKSWTGVHPKFGRLICWINFSAGAEFLAKGVCLMHNVGIQGQQDVPDYPSGDVHKWAKQFRADWQPNHTKNPKGKTIVMPRFGTLGELYDGRHPPLERLCSTAKATPDEEDLLIAGYILLTKTIRNRDAHAYVEGVRDEQFFLVPDLFGECLKLLVSMVPPSGSKTVSTWRQEDHRGQPCP
jgi:hypothetical protein